MIFSGLEELEPFPGRKILVEGSNKIGKLSFEKYIKGTYGASDYGAICKHFEVVLLENVPRIEMSNPSVSKRFILFVKNPSNLT